MDLDLAPEQEEFRRSVVDFARRELADSSGGRSPFPGDRWRSCAAFGIQGLPVPPAYGGGGADAVSIALALEALGYGCRDNGFLFSLNAHIWSCQMPILRFGNESQKSRFLPPMCRGDSVGVQAMTEPDSGSDALSLNTSATKDGDVFVLNGSKTFITNAPVADVIIVFASTERDLGFAGISAFIVERGSSGLTVGPAQEKMGLTSSPLGEVFLDDCRVPETNLLGPLGAGMAVFNFAMEWERGMILASAVGTMERQLEECVSYARGRTQGGRQIGQHQAISHKIADMRVRLEAGRLLLYRFAKLKSRGRPAAVEASITKLFLSEALLQSSLDAIQIHGGYGYMAEAGIEADVRDAVASRIYSGTSEIQRNLIARHSGL